MTSTDASLSALSDNALIHECERAWGRYMYYECAESNYQSRLAAYEHGIYLNTSKLCRERALRPFEAVGADACPKEWYVPI